MGNLFDRLRGRRDRAKSGHVARERLRLILVHDRTNLSEEQLAQLRDEMIELISKYVDVDRDNVEISVERHQTENWLVANIPLRIDRARRG